MDLDVGGIPRHPVWPMMGLVWNQRPVMPIPGTLVCRSAFVRGSPVRARINPGGHPVYSEMGDIAYFRL